MAIRKRLAGSILLTGAATALVIGVSAGPARAAVTFTVRPGGSFTATAGATTLTDTKTGISLSCASSKAAGSLKSGSGLSGKVAVTYTNSTGVLKVLTTGGNLHIFNVSGCGGLIGSGDPAAFSGSYTVTPTQTVTSP